MIKVIIVEDNKIIRSSLNALINGTPDFTCIGDFNSCESLFNKIDILEPDVILMDINLPGISGIEGIKIIKVKMPKVNIIVLTIYEESNLIYDAILAGASGYLVKGTSPAKLLESIQEAYQDGAPMNTHIAKKILTLIKNHNKKGNDIDLTEREIDILKSMGEGKTYQEIADLQFLSKNTIRYHIKNIYKKLHVHTQTAAVSEAIKKGII